MSRSNPLNSFIRTRCGASGPRGDGAGPTAPGREGAQNMCPLPCRLSVLPFSAACRACGGVTPGYAAKNEVRNIQRGSPT